MAGVSAGRDLVGESAQWQGEMTARWSSQGLLMRHGDVAYFADSARRLAPEEVMLTPAGLPRQGRLAARSPRCARPVITSGLRAPSRTARLVVEHNDQPEGSVAET